MSEYDEDDEKKEECPHDECDEEGTCLDCGKFNCR